MPNKNKILDCKEKIRIQFLGAVGNVTGSRTLLETSQSRVYVDAGLYQGLKHIEEKNYDELETDVSALDSVLLTHAHVDHSGLLPRLVKEGFRGEIYCTPSTADLLRVVLPDAGKLMEEEFKKLSKKKIRILELDGPLFTEDDAKNVLKFIRSVAFGKKIKIRDFAICYFWAGHILGAAHLSFIYKDRSLLFSGDIGPLKSVFHKERESALPKSSHVILESTYALTSRKKENASDKIQNAIRSIVQSRGMLILPAFAVGRAQLLLYVFFQLIVGGKIPPLKIFLDSPMAVKATFYYMKYPQELKREIIDSGYFDFLRSPAVRLIESIKESKALNAMKGPGIIISASGMCHGGRVLHHLYNRIWSKENYILFTGYQAGGTLGRLLLEGSKKIRIFGRELTIRAKIDSLSAFSAHADSDDLIQWIRSLKANAPDIVFINHGDDASREALKEKLLRLDFLNGTKIELPKNEQIYYI